MSKLTCVLACLGLAVSFSVSGCGSKSPPGGASEAKPAASPSFLKLAKVVDGGLTDGDQIASQARAIIDAKEFPAQFADISPMQGNSSSTAQDLVRALGRAVKRVAASGKTVEARRLCRASVEITKDIVRRGPEVVAAAVPAAPTEEAKAIRVVYLHAFQIWCMTSILEQLRDLKIVSSAQLAEQALAAEKSRSEQLEALMAGREHKRILAEFAGPTRIEAALGTIQQALQ